MKNIFKTLFGLNAADIKPTVIIMPFDIPGASKTLAIDPWMNGKLFATAQGQGFTLIRSGMSAGFVGDCVLRLKDTPCQKIFFLGTCGLIERKHNLDIGRVITLSKVYALESFCEILSGSIPTPRPITADNSLIPAAIPRICGVSFASMHEETKHTDLFNQLDVQVIEMECAAFFTASQKIGRVSSALLVISDILDDPNICFNLSKENKDKLARGVHQACQIITQNI